MAAVHDEAMPRQKRLVLDKTLWRAYIDMQRV